MSICCCIVLLLLLFCFISKEIRAHKKTSLILIFQSFPIQITLFHALCNFSPTVAYTVNAKSVSIQRNHITTAEATK